MMGNSAVRAAVGLAGVLVTYRGQARAGPGRRALAGVCAVLLSFVTAGASCHRDEPAVVAVRIAGLNALATPPAGTSWAPRPATVGGLTALAQAGARGFELHTAGGDRGFLPGVNLGSTNPGFQAGELAITVADYRAWFAAMGRLGVRVMRNYTIHPPAFYTNWPPTTATIRCI